MKSQNNSGLNNTTRIDILLLQPPSPPFMDIDREFTAGLGSACAVNRSNWGHSGECFFNHELAWSAGVLEKAGFAVAFKDAQADRSTMSHLMDEIQRIDPEIIVMLINLPSLSYDLALAGRIKGAFVDKLVIAIGSVCKIETALIASAIGIDYVVLSDPYHVLPKLMAALNKTSAITDIKGIAYMQDGSMKIVEEPDESDNTIDSLPLTPFHLIPIHAYKGKYFAQGKPIAPIVSSKGCTFKCSYYCPYPLAYGDTVRFRKPASVVDEIEQLVNTYGVKDFIFRDQNFTFNKEHARHVCSQIIDRGLKINWVCETRLALADDSELLKNMSKAGCSQINFGLETGDSYIFETLGKPGSRYEQIKTAVEITRQAGIRAHAHVIVGLPGEKWATIIETAKLLHRCEFDSVNISFLTPYPGTGYFADIKAMGYLSVADWNNYSHDKLIIRTHHMNRLELKLAHILLSNYFGNAQIHKSIMRKLTHLHIKTASYLRGLKRMALR